MIGAEALAGAIELRPGQAESSLRSTRPALASTLARGKPASAVPDLLATVFSLCGGAHRLVARHAIAAARGQSAAIGDDDRVALQVDTLREHVRRIWLDWPAVLAGVSASGSDLAALRDCPLLRRVVADDALAVMRAWLSVHALDMPAIDWLRAWEADPAGWLDEWSRRVDTLPARLLASCRDEAVAVGGPPRPLRVHAARPAMVELGARMAAAERFVLLPDWPGDGVETGPWTRLNDNQVACHADGWTRLGSRLAECVRLVLHASDRRAGAGWLDQGALALAAGEGLAWAEMARGLLVHRVRLDRGTRGGAGSQADADASGPGSVAEYDVLAPTEWNFHPRGPVARALAGMAADAPDARVRVLAAAFDPCVPVRIGRGPQVDAEDASCTR